MEFLLKKLQQEFHLPEKEILLLQALLPKPLDAKTLSRKAQIPQGRIYDYLNSLLEKRLIQRTEKKPFMYFLENLEESILSFMQRQTANLTQSQSQMLEYMKGSNLQQVDIINGREEFVHQHNLMITEAKHLKYICVHGSPGHLLNPFEIKDYLLLRKALSKKRVMISMFDKLTSRLVHKTYNEALKRGLTLETICEKRAFQLHVKVVKSLGKPFFQKWKTQIIKQLTKYPVRAYIIDEYLPTHIDINEKRVNVSIRHGGIVHGMVVMNSEMVKLYNEVFEERQKRAKDVLPLIKKMTY